MRCSFLWSDEALEVLQCQASAFWDLLLFLLCCLGNLDVVSGDIDALALLSLGIYRLFFFMLALFLVLLFLRCSLLVALLDQLRILW
jgi:hypothetical protein